MPGARNRVYLADGVEWQMLAVTAGRSSPEADYTAQPLPAANSFPPPVPVPPDGRTSNAVGG
jgi:hypothetical protein